MELLWFRNYWRFTARFGGKRIKSVSIIKYLGISVETDMGFNKPFENILENSVEMFSRIRIITRSKCGMSNPHATLIYKAIYLPRVNYGASMWLPDMNKVRIKKTEKSQRRILRTVIVAYNTVSTHAMQVISGIVPLNLTLAIHAKL